MSNELSKILGQLHDLERMPRLGQPPRLSNEALNIILESGRGTLSVESLKIKLESIEEGCITIALAFCDSEDRPIVNIGRFEFRGAGSTLTVSKIANTLNFTVS